MVHNNNGEIALVHMPPLDVKFRVGEREYHFVVRNGVSLCWVREGDVDALFSYKRVCCGGVKKSPIRYANEAQVEHWNRRII